MAETGRSCWGRGQQDASGSEADAGSRNPGSVTEGDGEGKPGRKEPLRSDRQALCQSDAIAVSGIRHQPPSPLSLVASSSPAPPKGEPLACRSAFVWTLKARRGAKGRALLQRPAASGQRTLSSCRWPRQRSTTVSETSCFARPVESYPACQRLPLWGSCHACGVTERATVNLWKMHDRKEKNL